MNCQRCGDAFQREAQSLYCWPCVDLIQKERNAKYAKENKNGTRAHQAVSKAVKAGELPRLDGSIFCVDCGEPAKHYDHRDYLLPLTVQPVCISCNKLRGTAMNRGNTA